MAIAVRNRSGRQTNHFSLKVEGHQLVTSIANSIANSIAIKLCSITSAGMDEASAINLITKLLDVQKNFDEN